MIRSSRLARWAFAVLAIVAGSASLPATDIYVSGYDNGTQKNVFGKIDSATGVYSQLQADIGANSVTGLAWNPSINQFNTLSANGVLNTITTTGIIGSQIASGISSNSNLAYNPATSTMYKIGATSLSTLNPTNGSETSIGNPGNANTISAAFVSGTLFGAVSAGAGPFTSYNFGSYNLNSAAYTGISTNNFYSGLQLVSDGINLFAVKATGVSRTLYSIDPITGSSTTLTSITGAPSVFYSASMIPVAVPEPSTYALAAIATGVMAAISRRRKARQG